MLFDPAVSLGNILTLLTILTTIALYGRSKKTDRALQRAAFLRDYTLAFYEQRNVAEVFFEIDYEYFKLPEERKRRIAAERRLIPLLDFLNSVGFSWEKGLIDLKDIEQTTLGYAVYRVYDSSEVRDFLDGAARQSMIIGMKGDPAFQHFRKLACALDEKRPKVRRGDEAVGAIRSMKTGAREEKPGAATQVVGVADDGFCES